MGKPHQVKSRHIETLRRFGEHARKLREDKGLSQEELADITGISINSVNTIESGKLNPTLATVWAIADTLGIPYKKLFEF